MFLFLNDLLLWICLSLYLFIYWPSLNRIAWIRCLALNRFSWNMATTKSRSHQTCFLFLYTSVQFSSVQSLSRVRLFATPWIAAHQASLSITNSLSSLRLMVHRVSDAIQPSHLLSSPSPLAPNPSQHQGLFQWVNSSHEVAKVLEFQL